MSSFFSLLRGGVRLSLLLAPRDTPSQVSPWPALVFAFIAWLLVLPVEWVLAQAPRTFELAGTQTFLIDFALTLLAAFVLVALTQRKALWMAATAWLAASALLPSALYGALTWWKPEWADHFAVQFVWLLWCVAIVLRLAAFLAGHRFGRALAAAALSCLVASVPWLVASPDDFIVTDWPEYWASNEDDEDYYDEEEDESAWLVQPEASLYAQPDLLNAQLSAMQPQRPGVVDMFVVGFGGDGEENVFRNEVEFLRELATHRLDAGGRQFSLLNNAATAETWPLATATNLERALAGVAQRMNPDEDILFLYLTSHGSEDHELYVNQPPLPLDQITPGRLRATFDASGIRWRVIVVSACYSGGFINALRDPRTLVVTAARHDRTSFGCGNTSAITWFGRAFLVDGLNASRNFRSAWLSASRQIAQLEEDEGYDPSEPQWAAGEAIGTQLEKWRTGLPASQTIAFEPAWVPPEDAEQEDDLPADEAPESALESMPESNEDTVE